MSAKTIRLTVADAHSRHDLVVPADSTVAELLTVGGVDLQRYVGTTTSGAAIELDSEVSATPGDGGVIWLFDRTAAAETGRSARSAKEASPAARSRQHWTLLALLLAIALAMVACTVISPGPVTIPVSAAVLLAGALVMLGQPVHGRNTYVAYFAPTLAAAAGALALASFTDAGAMMAAGAVAGATVACARHALTRAHGRMSAGSTAVIAVIWSVLAVVNAAAFIAGIPAAVIAAVEVAADDLIDTPFVIRDAQGIRARPPAEPSPVHAEGAAGQYRLARWRSEAGIVMACALALLSSMYAVPAFANGSIEGWCVLGGTLGIGCYFLLTSRKLRDGLSRGAALATGTVLAVLAAATLVATLQFSALLVAVILVLAGTIVGCLTVPLSADWRSLGWSRTGDILEGLTLALGPAALLYGSGVAGQILEVFS
jgi:hypothetical protein